MINYIYVVLAFIMLSSFGYGYKLYNDNQIHKLNQATLEKSIDEQYQVILKNKKDFDSITEINKNLILLNDNNETRISSLNDIFTKEKTSNVIIDNKEYQIKVKRDIGKIAVKKPKLVQDIINQGTLNAFGCFEKITDKNFKGDINVCK